MVVAAFAVVNGVPRADRSDDFVMEDAVDAADLVATDVADADTTDATDDVISTCCYGTGSGGGMMLSQPAGDAMLYLFN